MKLGNLTRVWSVAVMSHMFLQVQLKNITGFCPNDVPRSSTLSRTLGRRFGLSLTQCVARRRRPLTSHSCRRQMQSPWFSNQPQFSSKSIIKPPWFSNQPSFAKLSSSSQPPSRVGQAMQQTHSLDNLTIWHVSLGWELLHLLYLSNLWVIFCPEHKILLFPAWWLSPMLQQNTLWREWCVMLAANFQHWFFWEFGTYVVYLGLKLHILNPLPFYLH